MIYFVGDRPSSKMLPGAAPFEGAGCEARLKYWIWYLCDEPAKVRIVNQCDNPVFSDGDIIIALGRNAADSLGDFKHFALPHPSGLNRQLNNKPWLEYKLRTCKEWMRLQGAFDVQKG